MSTLSTKFQGIAPHSSVFEQAVRKLSLPVCGVFGTAATPTAIRFADSSQTLGTKDSAQVAASFPNTVKASGNKVLEAAGANPKVAQGKRVAVLFSGGPAAGGHNVVCGLKRILGNGNTLLGVKPGPKGLLKGNLFEITDAASWLPAIK